jgi:carbonic anhydrase
MIRPVVLNFITIQWSYIMKKRIICLTLSLLVTLPSYSAIAATNSKPHVAPYTATQETLNKLTPSQALQMLKDGNMRFINNKPINRNLIQQAKATSVHGQFPFAVILSCMDSRGSSEIILDQGIGDIFSIRVAGNVVDEDQLGSMEFATKAVGTKVVVVLGHTQCGAVAGACKGVQLGNLTSLLDKIQPAVQQVKDASKGTVNCNDSNIVNTIAKQNVLDMIKEIKEKSPIIREQADNKQIIIVGGMHDLRTGRVLFFDETGAEN